MESCRGLEELALSSHTLQLPWDTHSKQAENGLWSS